MPESKKVKAAGYVRVSSKEQVDGESGNYQTSIKGLDMSHPRPENEEP